MSLRDDYIRRIGSHREHRRDILASADDGARYGLDVYNGPVYQPPAKFNYRYELRRCKRIDAAEIKADRVLSKMMIEYCYKLSNQPVEIWSDPDTTDQLKRLIAETSPSIGRVIICDLKQASRRYVHAGIFFRSKDSQYSIRLVNYLLPFPPEPTIDEY